MLNRPYLTIKRGALRSTAGSPWRLNVLPSANRLGDAEYEWSEQKPIRLEPKEPRSETVLFPVCRDHSPIEEGEFQIEVTPSVGRVTKVKVELSVRETKR